MNRSFLFFAFVAFFPLSGASVAQSTAQETIEIQDSGNAYMKAIRFRRIATDVRYFDPNAPAPEITTTQKPEQKRDPAAGDFDGSGALTLISMLVLVIAAFIAFQASGNFSVNAKGVADPKRPAQKRKRKANVVTEDPKELASVLAIPDRKLALIVMTQSALAITAQAHDMLVQSSWTARDILRRVKDKTPFFSQLRTLVVASERVHFGQRDISEEEFQTLVEDIRPLFLGAST